LDIGALKARGIPVSCTRGGPSKESTSELTWALILSAYKRIRDQNSMLQQGIWRNEQSVLPILAGERLGLIGLGEIGSRVAQVGRAFGMDVVCWSPNMTRERAAEHSVHSVTLTELLQTSRIISLHIVSSPATKLMMNKAAFDMLRPDSILINTSRSTLIDHDALLEALNEGRLSMCALDVHDEEPVPESNPLISHPRALLTPHLGFVCNQVFAYHMDDVCASVTAYLADLPLIGLLEE
jgi:phosphoglycerate dehydrogenase-like enzyme